MRYPQAGQLSKFYAVDGVIQVRAGAFAVLNTQTQRQLKTTFANLSHVSIGFTENHDSGIRFKLYQFLSLCANLITLNLVGDEKGYVHNSPLLRWSLLILYSYRLCGSLA